MLRKLTLLAMILSLLFAGSAFAGPSAKFAAVYGDGGPYLIALAEVSGSVDDSDFDRAEGYTFATIKVPQDKELLVGVSAEVGLTTNTSIKGKSGGEAKAIADALGNMIVVAHRADVDNCGPGDGTCGAIAVPGEVTLNSRVQELEARLGGVIESCEDINGDGVIDVASECEVTDEEISLSQETLSAHHFNFILPNLDQGTYAITAYFTTEADAEIDICEEGDAFCEEDPSGSVSASALAQAWIGKHVVTVQQVRAVKNSIFDEDIIEIVD